MNIYTGKVLAGTLAVLLAGSTLTGCSEKETKQEEVSVTTAVNNYEKKAGDTEVTGEITSIIGNEITIAVGEAASSDSENDDERPTFENGERPSFDDGEMPSFGDGERPSFGNGERPSFREGDNTSSDGSSGGEGRRRRRRTSVRQTGEEKSYIIPVGMPINGLNGRRSDYSGLREGMVITLTINSDGVVCAAQVQ